MKTCENVIVSFYLKNNLVLTNPLQDTTERLLSYPIFLIFPSNLNSTICCVFEEIHWRNQIKYWIEYTKTWFKIKLVSDNMSYKTKLLAHKNKLLDNVLQNQTY